MYDAFRELFPSDSDQAKKQAAKKRLDVLLRHLGQGATQRNHTWTAGDAWLDSAIKEHSRRPFQGILVASADTQGAEFVLVANDLDADNSTWNPGAPVVARSAEAFVDALRPALRHVRSICFVDPYFDGADSAWGEPFRRLIEAAQEHRESDESIKVEVHCTTDHQFGRHRTWTEADEAREAASLLSAIQAAARQVLDSSSSLSVRVWSSRFPNQRNERLHNRYILFETGGINFGP